MKLYIRHKNETGWEDITEYLYTPSFIMNQTVDGTFNSLTFELRTPKLIGQLDMTKPIPPNEYIVKYTEALDSDSENENNTWHFITANNNNARVRKEVLDEENNLITSSLYIQDVNCDDILKTLDNKYLPNYTVTQPKSQFFSTFIKNSGAEFKLSQRFKQDGEEIELVEGVKRELANANLEDDEITFGYDNVRKEHYIEFTEINEASLITTFEIDLAKTATAKSKVSGILGGTTIDINVGRNWFDLKDTSDLKVKVYKEYYIGSTIEKTESSDILITYNGGYVNGRFGSQTLDPRPYYVESIGNLNTSSFDIVINKNTIYDKVRVYFSLVNIEESMFRDGGTYENRPVESRISGYDDDGYVKTFIDRIVLKTQTSAYDRPLVTKQTMLIEFIEKAIFDYNLNTREKIRLADDVKPFLNVVMKEGEYNDYTLRELLEKTFKYVGIIPKLNPDNTITYIKTNKVARYIDLEQENGTEKEHVADNFYDKVVSSTKNLVSQEDYKREIIPLTSYNIEFSNMTTDNSGFVTSDNIYYVVNAVLHTPNLEIVINGQSIKTNMGKDYYWDITERLFEEDIYNSFPNVRLDGYVADPLDPSPRSYFGLLTKANTISYKSGSNIISGLFNQGDYVPNYTPYEIVASFYNPNEPEYALTELLIVLAYTQATDIFGNKLVKPDITLQKMANYTLDITYVPIFKEITTKYLSNMPERKMLNWEKKLNLRDRVVAYEVNEQVLRNEMEKKGNVKISFTEIYKDIQSSIPVNSIINDNYYVTTKIIKINKAKVEVEYILQKNFILQNEDVRLPVEFERYNVPYEYVERELMLENHLIFMRELDTKYLSIISKGATQDFIEKTLLDKNNELNGTLYAKLDIDSRKYLMRVAKLDTRFTMVLKGDFLDNYTAGIQRYLVDDSGNDRLYTIPLSYTDGNGKFQELSNLEIGYSSDVPDLRLKLDDDTPYDILQFPIGAYDNKEVELDVKLINTQEPLMLMKDAREKVSITHTSYLQNETEDIKFYHFKPITNLGVLVNDVVLTDDLQLSDIDYSNYNTAFTTDIEEISFGVYKITITSTNIDDFANGIVLINNTDDRFTLVGVIKNPIINYDTLEFYIASTRTGVYDLSLFVINAQLTVSAALERTNTVKELGINVDIETHMV